MRQMIDNEREHDEPTHQHVTRREVCLDIVPVNVGLRPGTPILNCQLDRQPDVNNDRGKQEQANCPQQRTEIPEVLRVTINPIWSNKNLQVAEQMSDHEKNQNDAGNRDDHFFSNGRPIKSRQQSHDTELSTAENGSGGMCCPQRVAKSNTVGRRVEIKAAAGAITLRST